MLMSALLVEITSLQREEPFMKASDIMVTDVITVKPNSDVAEVAALLLTNRISAVPVVDDAGTLVGMISVGDLMTREIVSAAPDTSVADIATLLERYRIKRVPIVRDGEVVGIVSRANLIQALATFRKKALQPQPITDAELREKVVSRLKSEPWARPNLVNVTVTDGIVDLWGIVDTSVEKQALRVAVEVVPGVKAVNDNVIVRPVASGT